MTHSEIFEQHRERIFKSENVLVEDLAALVLHSIDSVMHDKQLAEKALGEALIHVKEHW